MSPIHFVCTPFSQLSFGVCYSLYPRALNAWAMGIGKAVLFYEFKAVCTAAREGIFLILETGDSRLIKFPRKIPQKIEPFTIWSSQRKTELDKSFSKEFFFFHMLKIIMAVKLVIFFLVWLVS